MYFGPFFLRSTLLSQENGNGIQSVYLTELPADFAEVLAGLIGEEARLVLTAQERPVDFEGNSHGCRSTTISTFGSTGLKNELRQMNQSGKQCAKPLSGRDEDRVYLSTA